MKCIMGIDPGLKGGLAFYYPDTRVGHVEDVPLHDGIVNPVVLRLAIDFHNPEFALIERVHSMPRQGVKSTFNFGHAAGVIFGAIGPMVKTIFVAPRVWKKYWGLDGSKEKARELAIELAPCLHDRLKRKKDHNRAEALLIAIYGARTLK